MPPLPTRATKSAFLAPCSSLRPAQFCASLRAPLCLYRRSSQSASTLPARARRPSGPRRGGVAQSIYSRRRSSAQSSGGLSLTLIRTKHWHLRAQPLFVIYFHLKRGNLMNRIVIALVSPAVTTSAEAGCEFATGPRSTDSRGNSYRTEQNLGGVYTTHRDGNSYSTTGQTLGGTWQERFAMALREALIIARSHEASGGSSPWLRRGRCERVWHQNR